MPDRVFMPRHDPPTFWDRLRKHWAEALLSVGTTVVGTAMLFGEVMGKVVSPSLATLPDWQTWVVSLFLAAGGVLWFIVTLTTPTWTTPTFWRVKQLAHLVGAMGWLGYAVGALLLRPEWPVIWVMALTLTAVCAGLYGLSVGHESLVRRKADEAPRPAPTRAGGDL